MHLTQSTSNYLLAGSKNNESGHNLKHDTADVINDELLFRQYALKMNVIRFLAICSIVWGHSLLGLEEKTFVSNNEHLSQVAVVQLGHIGTILFFIISGFFLNNNLQGYTISTYLKKRFSTIIGPWIAALAIFVVLDVWNKLSADSIFFLNTTVLIWGSVKTMLIYTSFWFVPVSILSTVIIIAFKKHVNKLWFGAGLFCVFLFYSFNLYHNWVPQIHTRAWVGYIFFIWLGVQLKQNLYMVHACLSKIKTQQIIFVCVITYILACAEGIYLKNNGCTDPFGSIRVSNAALCLSIFAGLLKTSRLLWVNIVKPRSYVYGVYLIHSILITEVLKCFSFKNVFLPQVILFIVVLPLSYLFTILLKQIWIWLGKVKTIGFKPFAVIPLHQSKALFVGNIH